MGRRQTFLKGNVAGTEGSGTGRRDKGRDYSAGKTKKERGCLSIRNSSPGDKRGGEGKEGGALGKRKERPKRGKGIITYLGVSLGAPVDNIRASAGITKELPSSGEISEGTSIKVPGED